MPNQPLQSTPLIGDPSRQAVDSLLGYDYQIWRSVEAWLRLGDRDVLFLECAEDYDVMGEFGAQTVQVKNSPADISLGSKDVRAAIANFWLLRARNANRGLLSLRFLTRGGVCFEQSRPFGEEKGIEFWKKAAAGDDAAAVAIGRFLATSITEQSLKAFLATASASELREQIIAPVEWLTSEPDIEAVKLTVQRLSVRMCQERGISVTVSTAVVNSFLASCREAAGRTSAAARSLTSEDRDLVFETATSARVPMTTSLLSRLGESLLTGQFNPESGNRVVISPSLTAVEAPPLPDFSLPREAVVCAILLAISKKGIALVGGSEGRGKTTVANLASRKLGGPSRWVDLSGLDEAAIKATLESLLVDLRGANVQQVLVLDDVPVGSDLTQPIWTRLHLIANECRARSHALILAAKGIHPQAVDSRIRSAQIDVVSVPDLTSDEIQAFFGSLGCPNGAAQALWAQFTLAQTGGGHPKLVYLRGLELRDRGWPAPTAEAWVSPPSSIEEARTVARQTAARTLPENLCEYLYSLSLALTPVSREVALHIGSAVQGLSAPGDALDSLIGRWVESQGVRGYRVTPLLHGQAALAWSKEKVASTHAQIFDAFVSQRDVRVDEALPILLHAWQSNDGQRLGNMVSSLITDDSDRRADLNESLAPILFMGRGTAQPAYAADIRSSVLFKMLQFRVAQSQKPELVGELAHEWEQEIERLPEGMMHDGSVLLRALTVASSIQASLPADVVVRALEQLSTLAPAITEISNAIESAHAGLPPPFADTDWIGMLFGFTLANCDSIDFQNDLLTALEQAGEASRRRMLQAFDIPFFREYNLLVDRAWINESKRDQPRWEIVVVTFQRAISLGVAWACEGLAILAARALSIVFEEYLDRPDEAFASLEMASDAFGNSAILREQKANVYFHRQRYAEALDLWGASLRSSTGNSGSVVRDPYACRKAGIAAGSLRRYDDATDWFAQAACIAEEKEMTALAGGAYFDAAYCAFKARSAQKTVELALRGLDKLHKDFDPKDEFQLFAAKKLAGHVLFWMLGEIKDQRIEPQAEPLLGQCSSPDKNENIATLPTNPFDLCCEMLVEIASILRVSLPQIDVLRLRLESSRLPLALFPFWAILCNECVEHHRVTDLCKYLLQLQRARWLGEALRQSGGDYLREYVGEIEGIDRSHRLYADPVFVLALLMHALSTGKMQDLKAAWEADLSCSDDGMLLSQELARAWNALSIDSASAKSLLRENSPASLEKLAAAARLLLEPNRSPAETGFWQIAFLTWACQSGAQLILDGAFDELTKQLANLWRPHLQSPALLNSPRISIPMLHDAIEGTVSGAAQLRRLMNAVSIAVGISLPTPLAAALLKAEKIQMVRLTFGIERQ